MAKIRLSTVLLFVSFLICGIISSGSKLGNGYWGYGNDDCLAEHGISHHYAKFINQPNITINGIDNESAWTQPGVYEFIIPMSNNYNTSARFFKSYMKLKYIYDNTSLYIRANWNDTTVNVNDNAFFCWNINCANYSSQMMIGPNAMKTPAAGETVDSWKFIYNPLTGTTNGSINKLLDASFGYTGWNPADTKETNFGFIYGSFRNGSNSFQLEMKRPLLTSEPSVDVQFHENVPVRFTTSVEDGMENQEHAISWTYDLNLTHNPQPDSYKPPVKTTISTISSPTNSGTTNSTSNLPITETNTTTINGYSFGITGIIMGGGCLILTAQILKRKKIKI